MAEVAQQLAWLGAALRSSPRDTGPIYCVPFVNETPPTETLDDHINQLSHVSRALRCKIDFRFERCEQLGNKNGQCWRNLFRNPVIVRGFPIASRPEVPLGLELPLKLGALLVGAKALDRFGDGVFLKGFSSMAFMTGRHDNTCSWHFLYKDDGSRIRYTDVPAGHTIEGNPNVGDMNTTRHIVGWSADTSYNIGKQSPLGPDGWS